MQTCSTETVVRLADGLGFAMVGVTAARPSGFAPYIRRWLSDGQHGQMDYLANNLHVRLDPQALLPGARSVICVADRYPARVGDGTDPAQVAVGRIARYAWGDDYHRVIKRRLFQLADALRARYREHGYRVAVDSAPVLEREHAQRAGLGWVGKHTLLVHPWLGSWLLLGEIVTTLPIDTAHEPEPMSDHCGTCTRCIDACPTDCLRPYQIDAQRCISYLTLEHRGTIDPSLHGAMGDWIAGCDVCQEVCPYNEPGRAERAGGRVRSGSIQPGYAVRPPGPVAVLLEILNWDAPARGEALKRSALKRIKLDQFKRNALIAAGNALRVRFDAHLYERVEQLAEDQGQPSSVRQTARQVLAGLPPQGQPGSQSEPLAVRGGPTTVQRQNDFAQCPDDRGQRQPIKQNEQTLPDRP